MKITRQEICESARCPWGYGLAYVDFVRSVNICYPVPFNLLIRYWRDLWFWICFKAPSYRDNYNREMTQAIRAPLLEENRKLKIALEEFTKFFPVNSLGLMRQLEKEGKIND